MIHRRYLTHEKTPFVVRTARPDDCAEAIALLRAATEERSDFSLLTRSEFAEEEETLRELLILTLKEEGSLWIVAEQNQEVIGSLDIVGGATMRTRHVGHFRIVVRRDRRYLGVGTALLETMLMWARDHPFLEKVRGTLFASNTRAISFFARFGFENEGTLRREYLVAPGRYADALLLAKRVK